MRRYFCPLFSWSPNHRLRLRRQAQFPPAGVPELVKSKARPHSAGLSALFRLAVERDQFYCSSNRASVIICKRSRGDHNRAMIMKSSVLWTFLLVGILEMNGGVDAWGGLFNRFTPEMLSNLGYGGQGYRPSSLQRPLVGNYGNDFGEGLQFAGEDDSCDHRLCGRNEFCCPGQICVMTNSADGDPEGTCFYFRGLKQGELCVRDNDCETGLMCADVPGGDTRSCQPPVTSNKQYSEECLMSRECDITRGLCCQVQRRHRQATRKVCSYFKDPLVCIGPVATDQIKSIVQYTSGEKRITQGQHNRNLLYKRGFFI